MSMEISEGNSLTFFASNLSEVGDDNPDTNLKARGETQWL